MSIPSLGASRPGLLLERAAPLAVILLAFLGAAPPPPAAAQQTFDVLIRGGLVIDGTGNPGFLADVGIMGDRVVAVSRNLRGARAARVLDAAGMVVTPAFIDIHSHADRGLITDDLELRRAYNVLSQGVATVVGGPDGRNRAWPIQEETRRFRSQGIALNVVPMVGHNTVRREVMGEDYERKATAEEVARMGELVRQGMEEGAWGLGTGLEYRPGRFSHPDEVVELARVVADYGGFHFSHMRGAGLLPKWQLPSMVEGRPVDGQDALLEIINIAREAGIPSVGTHVKAKGRGAWGRAANDIILVELARAEGLQVFLDQYAYEGHSGSPATVIPVWALVDPEVDTSGGTDAPVYDVSGVFDRKRENLWRVMEDPELGELLRVDTESAIDYNGGPDRIVITDYHDGGLVGRTIAEVAEEWELTPEETIWELVLQGEIDHPQGALLRPYSLHAFDVEHYMRQDYTATSSDGRIGADPGTHPRHYGAFTRKIATYVKEKGTITLPFAIRSSTGLPAAIVGLPDRGLLREGFKADVLVFDYDALTDRSTALEPARHSEGVEYLLVNGAFAIDGGEFTGALAGEVIERHRVQRTAENPLAAAREDGR
jgi:N-acyl-D-amino-acid deacylase